MDEIVDEETRMSTKTLARSGISPNYGLDFTSFLFHAPGEMAAVVRCDIVYLTIRDISAC
jgi:hypothetical protein